MRGIVPQKILDRQDKMGFGTPQDEWFRTPEFKIYILKILKSDSFKNRNIICPKTAIKLFKKHLNGSINISKEIWKWINLEIWFRKFVD